MVIGHHFGPKSRGTQASFMLALRFSTSLSSNILKPSFEMRATSIPSPETASRFMAAVTARIARFAPSSSVMSSFQWSSRTPYTYGLPEPLDTNLSGRDPDRKSTRLNSSHGYLSDAV